MFSKLKNKLKESLLIFSKKTEEVLGEEEVSTEKKAGVVEEKIKKEKNVPENEVEKKTKKEKIEIKEKAAAEELAGETEEKKSFLDKIKESFSKREKSKDVREKEPAKVEKEEVKITEKKKVEVKEKSAEFQEEEKSFFKRIKQTITTKIISEEKFNDLFWDLELALLENNVSVAVIEKIKDDLKRKLVDRPLPRDIQGTIQETLKNTLTEILSFDQPDLLKKIKQKDSPYVIAFFGINGAGKTTSIAKLAHYLQKNGLSVVLAAGDTFRAAAIQQLQEHADKLKLKMIQHGYGADAAAVAFDAVKYAEKNKFAVVMVDTAGRLHSNTNLMVELAKIIRVAKPDLKLFVGESITGNDCIEQAQKFDELVKIDGVILTKADVDEKGGAQLSISYTIKKPILFLGVGQEYKDLEVFDKEVILRRLGLEVSS